MEKAELVKFRTELEANLKAIELREASLKRKIAAVEVLLEEDELPVQEQRGDPATEVVAEEINHQPVAFFDVIRQARKAKT